MDFDVRQFGMNSSEYQKYMNNEMTSQQKEIDLQVSQDEDITTVSFIKLGGHAEIQCLEILTDKQKLDIINYESNYAREITVRRIGYKIHNPNKYELGKIDFKFFE